MSQYSFVRYTSAGSAGPYNVPFPYRDKADVKAYVDDVEALFSWTTSSSITLNNAPAIGAIVEIKRNTSRSARLVQWSSVNQIDADNLETDSLQAFYISQEAFDAAGEGEQVATAGIEDGAVTNSKLEDMQQNTIKGRVSSGTGDPENITGTQVATMLPEFAGASKGLVPASLNVEGTFLRGDGQWAIPEGTGGGGGGGSATISDGDKGDITVSGSGAVWTIDPNSVTFAKMADMDSGSLIYRRTGGSGDPEAQTLATLKADLGLNGTNSGDQTITLTGDVTGSGSGSFAATIANDAVTTAKMANVASGTVFYRTTVGTGDPEVQPLATLKNDLGLIGSNTGDQTITLTGDVTGTGTGSFAATIANDAVSNAKLANMANATIKGRTTAGTGDPEDLTAAQATALLDTFTTSLKGLAPASGGGTTNFLRADGQWVAPPAGGGGSQNLFETIAVAGNTSVVADATNDTLTLSAGANMAITTDAANDTITFAVTGLGSLAAKSSIENADVAANAAIAHTKLASITSGQVLLGNGSNVPTATAISGDATLASSGAVTIANNAVSFAKMADIPTNNIVGRVTGGTGDPEDLTADEVITLINTASTNTLNFARVAGAAPTSHNQAWSTITSTPTTLSGYGITDALSNSASSTQTGTFGDIKLRDDTSPSHYLTITDAENLTQDVTLSLNMNNGNRTLSLAGNLTASGAATVSGTNTGDQTITLTGDVTGTGTGSFAATVAANAVDMTKLADISVNQVIGRVASGTGDPKALTADEVISVINAAGTNTINTARLQSGGFQAANQTLSNIAAQTTGGFFAFADSGTPTRVMTAGNGISITNGNGNTGNPTFAVATGDYGDITVSASGATWTIDNDAVTYAKIQNVSATNRLLGRATAGAGDIEELDATAGRTVLGLGTIATQAANNVAITGGSISSTTNIGFTQSGTGASTRTVDAKLKEYVSLADFGADKTGATDCRTAVVNAVAAAKAAGVPLFIPEGQYLINPSSSIVLQDVTILGAGVLDGSNSALNNGSVFRIAATNPTIVPFKIRRGVTLDGISWYYNGQAATGSTRTTFAPTLEFDYTDGAVQFVYIRNCVAFNSWRWLNIAGAANAGAVGHIWITNNTICAISRGIEISLNREVIKIIGNTFTYGHWLDAAADNNTALGVAGYMRGSSGQAGAVAVYYQEGDGIWFTNNLVFGNKNGILMEANGLVQLCTFADNFFDQTLYPIAATGNGANCQFTKSQIVGNNFISYSPIDNTLAGINVILGSAGSAATEHMVITGNTFSNAREHSIRVQGNNSRRVTITGNVFSGTATLQTSGSYYGVSCAGANSDLLISGNTTFQDNGSYAGGVEASAARSINLSGNDFRNCKEVVKITAATDVHMTGNRSTSTVGTYSDDITGVTGTVQASGNNFDKPNPAIGNRIRSDFSNATVNLRTAFQTSTTNGNTSMWGVPNGTATTAAMAWTNNPDPTNASYMQIGMFNNEAKLISSSLGSGTNYPLTITTGGSERARLDTNGVFMVNTTALGGLTGLGGLSFKAALNGDVMLGTLARNAGADRHIGVFTTDDPASDDRARITFQTVAGGSSSNSRILFATNTYGVSGGERMRIDEIGNVGIGATSFGTGAAGVLAIKNGTEPSTAVADTVQFYSVDRSAGNTIPAIYCEGSGVTNAGITSTAVTHKIALKVNGTVYYLLATTNAT